MFEMQFLILTPKISSLTKADYKDGIVFSGTQFSYLSP